MRTKTLLMLILLSCGILNAQDTIRTLVISEVRLDSPVEAYVEITNVGNTTINLAEFELGVIGPWTVPWTPTDANYRFMLPDRDLAPGESFMVGSVHDWSPEKWLTDPDNYAPIMNKKEMWTLADIKLHMPESPTGDPTDSITPYYHVLQIYDGRDCIYLRHHVSETDSVVIDQVNGIFDEADGTSRDAAHDVAGVTNATVTTTLVRKFSVKQGNLDFEAARGQDLAESEWIPIPYQLSSWEMDRKLFWTAGNHGDYNLDETTLISGTIDINWAESILTVPWGVRNEDSVMMEFDQKPGLAWHYTLAGTHEDSAFISARTGDILTVYACGNDLDMVNFTIQVAEPTADANIVIPKRAPDPYTGYFTNYTWDGINGPLYIVTDGVAGMDTIHGYNQLNGPYFMGITYATRVDTLFKYLEKAPKASWEMVWVDGKERPDLKNGDKLKVTAEDGSVKEYFIKVEDYRPSHNAYVSSITWPDIPEFYKGIFGWMGDTIPNFVKSKYQFKVQVPYDVPGIPALVGKTEDINAKVVVNRAKSMTGAPEDRLVTFTATAEDDTSVLVYEVQLEKEKDPTKLQAWSGEPFLSQLIFWEQWSNGFVEICNPGNQPLDLSNYMLFFNWSNDPAEAITWGSATGDFANRYMKYIPGYKWVDETNWAITPGIAVQDLNISPIVQPGDVFVLGDIRTTAFSGYPWFASEQCDIDFSRNPWGEVYTGDGSCARQWTGANFYLYKILNDSIKLGTKPANDPNDFELIETFGGGDGNPWVIGGQTADMIHGWVRKPEFYKGKTGFNESFGTNTDDSEWLMYNQAYWDARNAGWPQDILLVADGLGNHFMNEVTIYKSTVGSNVYKVSDGYTMDEEIRGVITGTKVTGFLENIIPADTGQDLTLISGVSGDVLADELDLMNGDTLMVKSTDGSNTTKYVLEVTDEGLSNDALLVSSEYTITVEGETGMVTGFDPGTLLTTVVENVTVPAGAAMNIIDANDAYVPLKMLNFDTLYVDVMASHNLFFEVIAENGTDKIVYQLMPNSSSSDAYVISNLFNVDQELSLIDLIPPDEYIAPRVNPRRTTSVDGLLSNLIPAPGATMVLVDKYGYERIFGDVMKDDKLLVTAADGVTTRIYYLQMLGETGSVLAYVLSDVYWVDQIEYMISGVMEGISVSEFIANLVPAPGATLRVTDAEGVENTGTLQKGDLLVVTSGDELLAVVYSVGFATSVEDDSKTRVKVYPNPTSDRFMISGLESGNRIQINNILGALILDRTVSMDREVISLEGQKNGIYFIIVMNNEKIIGRYKLILK